MPAIVQVLSLKSDSNVLLPVNVQVIASAELNSVKKDIQLQVSCISLDKVLEKPALLQAFLEHFS